MAGEWASSSLLKIYHGLFIARTDPFVTPEHLKWAVDIEVRKGNKQCLDMMLGRKIHS